MKRLKKKTTTPHTAVEEKTWENGEKKKTEKNNCKFRVKKKKIKRQWTREKGIRHPKCARDYYRDIIFAVGNIQLARPVV